MRQRRLLGGLFNNIIRQIIILILLLVQVPNALAQYVSVEPEVFLQRGEQKKGKAQLVSQAHSRLAGKSSIPVTSILLKPLSKHEQEEIHSSTVQQNMTEKRKVGIGRPVPLPYCNIIDPSLFHWVSLPEGGHVAVFSIKSPEAAALRVEIKVIHMLKGTEFRFYNPNDPRKVYGPYLVDQIQRQMVDNSFWSPVIEGDSIAIEIFLPKGLDCKDLSIAIPQVSHLWLSVLRPYDRGRFSGIGASGYCNIDVACTSWAGSSAEQSVAEMIFTEGGDTYGCTGTALNDKDPTTSIPYFLTAHHCIATQAAASSLVTYWNFQKSSCYGPANTGTQLGGGAKLLLTSSSSMDFTLLRLYQDPPSGTALAGWTTTPVGYGDEVAGIHYPEGDLKKISFGTVQGFEHCTSGDTYTCYPEGDEDYILVGWYKGITESGSSGSPLFDLQGYVVGVLAGGTGSCLDLYPNSDYSRFDRIYPLIKQWIGETPVSDTTPPDTSIVYGPSGVIDYSNVTFTWTGSDDTTSTSDLVYSYKLDGYDSNWSGYSSSTSKTYNGLPNNSYIFEVRAKDEAGNIDPSPASRSFTVNVSSCSSSHLNGCITEYECKAVGGYWYDGLCHADPLGSPAASLDNWHVRSAPVSNQLYAVTYGKNIFVAVGNNGTILTSPNGTVWTNRSVSGISNLKSVAYGNNTFVAVGWNGTILTSTDGITWTRRTSGTSKDLEDVIFAGNTFVVVGDSGTILTSQKGTTWTARVSGTDKTLSKITYGKGVFVAVGGLVLTSSDAITWTQRIAGSGKFFSGVAYGNSIFVAVNIGGTIFTSPDGITWMERTSIPCSIRTEGVVYIYSTFIATGSSGEIFTSPDGITWTSRDSGVFESLEGVTYGNNSVVIVGFGYILDDPDNPFGGGTGTNIILQSDPFASPATVCDANHPNLCTTEVECTGAGLNWCNGVCQAGECPNQSPVIDFFSASPAYGEVPLDVTFTCTAHDPDGTIASYKWDFDGDGNFDKITSDDTVIHTYNTRGTYYAEVTVADNNGATVVSDPITIRIAVTGWQNHYSCSQTCEAQCGGDIACSVECNQYQDDCCQDGLDICGSQCPLVDPPSVHQVGFYNQDLAEAPLKVSGGKLDVCFNYTGAVNILAGVLSDDFKHIWWLGPDCSLDPNYSQAVDSGNGLSCQGISMPVEGGYLFWLVSPVDLSGLDWENGIYELLFYQVP